MIETKIVTPDRIEDLNTLFSTNKHTEKCWCMWHIISVKAFHAGGAEANRAQLTQLAETSPEPIGIIAYKDSEPVGWCAVGPRERYARAIKTPSYKHKGEEPYSNVWLVPCFFTRDDVRKQGITGRLLETAVFLFK